MTYEETLLLLLVRVQYNNHNRSIGKNKSHTALELLNMESKKTVKKVLIRRKALLFYI